ncbi:MAG: hypothetical protein IJD35_04375 [Clostridia bacterium]|nr:hypothetical protein [Clostridia bacterium]
MGFGFLFYGFLMMIELGIATSAEYALSVDVFPDLAGYLFMLTAAYRLELYAKGFARFKKWLLPLVAVGALIYGVSILSLFDISPALLESALHGLQYATIILQPIAFFCLFGGIVALALEVELPNIASRAKLLAVIGSAYYAAQLLFMLAEDLSLPVFGSFVGFLRYGLMIVWLIFVIMTEWMVFQCYMYICYEGEERITPEDAANPFAKFFNKNKKGRGGR